MYKPTQKPLSRSLDLRVLLDLCFQLGSWLTQDMVSSTRNIFITNILNHRSYLPGFFRQTIHTIYSEQPGYLSLNYAVHRICSHQPGIFPLNCSTTGSDLPGDLFFTISCSIGWSCFWNAPMIRMNVSIRLNFYKISEHVLYWHIF